jgi:hypothetical protein
MLVLPTALASVASAAYFIGIGWPGSRTARAPDSEAQRVLIFKQRFRIFVFSVIGVLPLSLLLLTILTSGLAAETLVFAVITAAVLPWAIAKVVVEVRRD